MADIQGKIYKRDFWAEENLKYSQPHFRLEKAARIINRIARDREISLLDIGCGPRQLRASWTVTCGITALILPYGNRHLT